jgi:hypothetical protein
MKRIACWLALALMAFPGSVAMANGKASPDEYLSFWKDYFQGVWSSEIVAGDEVDPTGTKGTWTCRLGPTGACMLFSSIRNGKHHNSAVAAYDPKSKAWKEVFFMADGSHLIQYYSAAKGELSGDPVGKTIKGKAEYIYSDGRVEMADIGVKIISRDKYEFFAVNRKSNEEKLTDFIIHSTRRQPVAMGGTREDFQAYCKAMEGRWVGEVTWVADWEGLGERGEKVTAYSENVISEDGNALLMKFFGGKGAGSGITYFDAGSKQINTLWVSSGGHVSQVTVLRKGDKWLHKGAGSNPEGTKTTGTSTLTITDNGNTHTWRGTGKVGEEKTDARHDVWRRVSK